MKLHKGLIIILILFLITSLSDFFYSKRSNIDLIQDHTNDILDTMISGVESNVRKPEKIMTDMEALEITIPQDYFPYAFINNNGVYDGAYIRTLERIGQIFHFKVYFNERDIDNFQEKHILRGGISEANEDSVKSEPLIQIEKGNNSSNSFVAYLEAISISAGMNELVAAISEEYNVDYSLIENHKNQIRVIEIIIIMMPLSWLCIFSILKIKSDLLASYDFLTKLSNRRAFDKRKDSYDIDTTTAIYRFGQLKKNKRYNQS